MTGVRRTVLRLLVSVVAGLCVVVALVLSGFPRSTICTRRDRTVLDIENLEKAFRLYQARRGAFPDSANGFNALLQLGIIYKLPKDGWGNDYLYALEDGRPVITSLGADGRPGGEGDAADVSNAPTRVTRR